MVSHQPIYGLIGNQYYPSSTTTIMMRAWNSISAASESFFMTHYCDYVLFRQEAKVPFLSFRMLYFFTVSKLNPLSYFLT